MNGNADNMERGYLKLWRKSIDSEVFADPELWRLWCWCLMRANYKPRVTSLKTGKGTVLVKLESGEFVFGRNSSGKELKVPPSTIWDRMKKIEFMKMIEIKSNSQYSIISIRNWIDYQGEEEKNRLPTDYQPTGNRLPTDTDKKLKHLKKEEKKKEKMEAKSQYGTFSNVLLALSEKSKLDEIFGSQVEAKIDALSEYMKSHGKRYSSHFATILSWERNDAKKKEPGNRTGSSPSQDYGTGKRLV